MTRRAGCRSGMRGRSSRAGPGPPVAALTAPYARVQEGTREGTRPIRAEADQGAEAAPTAIESGIRMFISGGVRRAADQSGAL